MPMRLITDARADSITIGDLSRRTGVHVETIRYYEKVVLLPAPRRSASGRRIYGPFETRILAFIRRARELGFTPDEIRTLLDLGGPGKASCAEVRAIAMRHLAGIRARIADLRKLERLLARTVARCSGRAVPDCPVIDILAMKPRHGIAHR